MGARRASAVAVALLAVSIALFGAAGLISGPAHGPLDPSAGRSSGATRLDGGLAAGALIAAGSDAEFRTQAPRPAERGRTLDVARGTTVAWLQRAAGRRALVSSAGGGSSAPFTVAPSRSPPSLLPA
jgi:hypothetical protein